MKRIIVAALLVVSAQLSFAQEISESVRVTTEQVPIAVLQAFEKEIGSIPDGGTWTVRVKRSSAKGKGSTVPVWYTYTNRKQKEKVEVRFSPVGEIEEAKGVTLLNGVSKSKKADSAEKN
jgi:hypothetical protein